MVSRAVKNPRSPRTFKLALGLIENRAGVTPATITPKPVPPETSMVVSA